MERGGGASKYLNSIHGSDDRLSTPSNPVSISYKHYLAQVYRLQDRIDEMGHFQSEKKYTVLFRH